MEMKCLVSMPLFTDEIWTKSMDRAIKEIEKYKCSAFGALPYGLEAAGEVQEKPAAARVGVEDADCQRDSECLNPAKQVSGEAWRRGDGERSDTDQRGHPG
ncbi:MAG: hypothetical protein JW908_09260 [Anaerolineales bacterium]|nr:hypothetical protein [Anaerolineales bacterium]